MVNESKSIGTEKFRVWLPRRELSNYVIDPCQEGITILQLQYSGNWNTQGFIERILNVWKIFNIRG